MTFEEKKQWLSRYKINELEIQRLREEIIRWRSLSEKATSSFSLTPGASAGADKISKAVEMIDEQQQLLGNKMIERLKLNREIRLAIDAMYDEVEKQVLLRRYINGDKWEQIAVDIKYNYRWTLAIHKKGIEHIKIINFNAIQHHNT